MASTKFYLNKPKAGGMQKAGDVSIDIRFKIDEQNKFQLATGEKIIPRYWDRSKQEAKHSYPQHVEINLALRKIKQDVTQLWRDHKHADIDTLKELAKPLIKYGQPSAPPQKKSLENFIREFIWKCQDGKIIRSKGTIQVYNSTLSHLEGFAENKSIDLTFEAVTLDFYHDLTSYLWDLGLKDSTVGKIIKTVKSFMREAYDNDLHESRSYTKKQFKVLTTEVDEIYLTEDEILKIHNTDLSESPELINTRDLFVFACWVGVRYSDLKKIRPEHISDNVLRITTTKTGEDVVIPFHPIAKEIWQRYNNNLPNCKSNQKFNKDLKDIAEKAKLEGKVQRRSIIKGVASFEWVDKFKMVKAHTARRSFATNCLKMGIPTRTIMMVTGHKTEKAFNRYIRITKEENAIIMAAAFDKSYKANMRLTA